jgi:glutamate/aspartate transport system substrate-binding protein
VSDLGGKRVGVIPSTTSEKALAAALKRAVIQAQIVTVSDHGEGLAGLETGKFDAYASDRVLLMGLRARAKDPSKLRLSGELFSYEPYGLMMRRGDNTFRVQVNHVLSSLYRSGEIVPIYERWFGPFQAAGALMQALYLLHSLPE